MTTRPFLNSLIALLLLCFFLSACFPEEPLPETSPTPAPSETPIPSPTIDWFPATATKTEPTPSPQAEQATPENPERGELLIEDNFSDDSLWETLNNADVKVSYEPEALSMVITGDKVEGISLSQHILPSEFYLTFTVETSMCSDNDQYGIIFWRYSSSGTFRFWANCSGQLMVDRVLPDGTSRLVNWQSARKLAPGAPSHNVFGILAKEGNVDFFVNDTYQFSIQTRPGLQGGLGIIARTVGDKNLTIRFSELIISKPTP